MHPNIGISLRISYAKDYDEKRDSLSRDWPKLMEELGTNIVFIPNSLKNIHSYLIELNRSLQNVWAMWNAIKLKSI